MFGALVMIEIFLGLSISNSNDAQQFIFTSPSFFFNETQIIQMQSEIHYLRERYSEAQKQAQLNKESLSNVSAEVIEFKKLHHNGYDTTTMLQSEIQYIKERYSEAQQQTQSMKRSLSDVSAELDELRKKHHEYTDIVHADDAERLLLSDAASQQPSKQQRDNKHLRVSIIDQQLSEEVPLTKSNGIKRARPHMASRQPSMLSLSPNTCKISSSSKDGTGHQLEAKLTCIMAAEFLDGLEYVHMPSQVAQHIQDPPSHYVDRVLDFSLFPVKPNDYPITIQLWNGKTETLRTDFSYRNCSDPDNARRAFVGDNCWTFFYGSLLEEPDFEKFVLQQAQPRLIEKVAHKVRGKWFRDLTVVVHIRRTDSFFKHDIRWTNQNYLGLLRGLQAAAGNRIIDFRVHTDDETLEQQDFEGITSIEIFNKSTPLDMVMTEMLNADVLLMTSSSLSNAMGLLRDPARPNLHPRELDKKKSFLSFGWTFMEKINSGIDGIHVYSREQQKSTLPDATFFADVIHRAVSYRVSAGQVLPQTESVPGPVEA